MAVSNGRHEKKPNLFNRLGFYLVAEWTGLEPATPGVTGRYSNRLNYHSALFFLCSLNRCHPVKVFTLIRSLAVSYSHMANATLPSALQRFTSVFGMGTGGSIALLPPGIFGSLIAVIDYLQQ